MKASSLVPAEAIPARPVPPALVIWRLLLLCTLADALGLAMPAHAYIGPGVGAGVIAVVLGILASILMAVIAIVWYPVKHMVKKLKSARATESDNSDPPENT